MVFVWNPARPRKSNQPFQIWIVFEWFLYQIPLDRANRRNLVNIHWFSNGLCMKSYYTTQFKATLSILIRFWIVFVSNPTRRRKSKQNSQFWPVFEWSLYQILLDHGNRSNLFNFESFWNGFCMKSYQTTQMEATFSILTSFWMVFIWNPTRPCQSKQPFQFSLDLNGFCMSSF